jgi:hypothetical protein
MPGRRPVALRLRHEMASALRPPLGGATLAVRFVAAKCRRFTHIRQYPVAGCADELSENSPRIIALMIMLLLGLAVLVVLVLAGRGFVATDVRQIKIFLRWAAGIAALAIAAVLLLRGAIDVAIPLGGVGLALLGWLSFQQLGMPNYYGGAAGRRENAERDATARGGSSSSPSGKMTEQEAYEVLGLQPGAGRDEIARAHRSLMKKLHPDQGGSTYLAARVNAAKDVLLRRHR